MSPLQTFASVREAEYQPYLPGGVPRIRKRLLEWESEHKTQGPIQTLIDSAESGRASNLLTRARHLGEISWDEQGRSSGLDQPMLDSDGTPGFLPAPSDYRAGDLIEHREDGDRLPLLAVCLGHLNGYYHLYTSTGQWTAMRRVKTKFVVRNFVNQESVAPLVDKLPKEILPYETLAVMSKMKFGPDRACGAELLRKMAEFQRESDRALQEYATRFENAHELAAEAGERYASLSKIHELVIASEKTYRRSFPTPPHELYALHRTIILDDVGFRSLGTLGSNSHQHLFEITPSEDVALVQNMQTLVRLFTDIPAKVDTPLSSLTSSQLKQSQIGRFVLKVREAIDESRRFRDWTPHGMLGPSRQDRPRARANWTDIDMSIMQFMLLWSGYDQFSVSSRLHWIGSAILRATGRYQDSEYLSPTTGWTFLQEIGYLTPWEIHARYYHRLPDVKISRERGFAPLPLGPEGIRPFLTRDVFDGKRHDWAGLKVFAIDSKSTTDIDDAVSIEATDVPGEHWVHIHVADPASRIRRQCALAERPSLTPLTLYLPGHVTNMWGVGDELQKLFSLAPNSPCLTFSGKVNEEGELLDYKITPARMPELIYMTPEDANAAVGLDNRRTPPKWSTAESFTVGKPPAEATPGRKMTSPAELQEEDLGSLKTLYEVANNLEQRRLASGAMPFYPVRPSVQTYFDDTSIEQTPSGLMTCNGDPTISVSWETSESKMVSSIMQLAGEIAAQWCAERNIPLPYLTQQKAEENFELLQSYTRNVYYPVLLRGDNPDQDMIAQLRGLLGLDELSTKPGRHFLMGIKGYARVTSPLRRYSDLIAHWQIESALVQEMESGKAIRPGSLPFSSKELQDDIFPWMRLRERTIRKLGNQAGTESYTLQAMLRAWKFPEESTGAANSRLPETFRFRVEFPSLSTNANATKKIISGTLDWFGVDAWVLPEGLRGLGLSLGDIRRGDVFEVKLADINVHLGEVFVEATGKVKMQKDQEAEAEAPGTAGER